MGPLLQQGGARTNNRFPCFLYGVRTGVCPGVGPEGWLRRFAHALGGVVCRGHGTVPCFCSQHPVFAPGSSEVAVGIFGLFVSFGSRICPSCPMHTVIFSSIQFLCILLLEERCVQIQALQHCSRGSQVPACLSYSNFKKNNYCNFFKMYRQRDIKAILYWYQRVNSSTIGCTENQIKPNKMPYILPIKTQNNLKCRMIYPH